MELEDINYVISEKEFYRRVGKADRSNQKGKNCLGNAFYLSGLIPREIFVTDKIKEITDQILPCEKDKAIFVTFEKKVKGQRMIEHILTIDPKNSRRVYCRWGRNGEFFPGERTHMIRACLYCLPKTEIKYAKINFRAVWNLVKDSKRAKRL